ncbi:leucine-rich repeat-containing protein 45 [Nematostella vectensis]|uniref:leucine-rich repeat-containing protein 45 n=1 Tax=Nematostella vectensis TaxID=45351 RepID=UPI0020776EFF|nr:leucine-rich repeat-containing protein 45 [Nematostella vectensis]
METFKKRYLRVCNEHIILPLESVISHSARAIPETSRCLDLSSYNLTPEDCHALATTLSDDLYFEELSFADCLLSEESCKLILLGLMQNRSIKSLNLKGNNIRCGGAEVLGQFLKRNTTVQSLQLEWNSIGLWESGIAAVAEGLAMNQVLIVLDLRNNQISHESASHLAMALRRNSTLRGLDLRWNNIGILGGRELLSAFKANTTITTLQLTGNNIPQDILKAIFLATKQNNDRKSVNEEHQARTEMMARELEKLETLKTKEVLTLRDEIDRERFQHAQTNKATQNKIDHLKSALEERKDAFDSLSANLSATEAELSVSQQKCHDLENLLSTLKKELHTEREDRTNAELKNHKELNKVLERNMELESSVSAMERKNKALEKSVNDLEKEIKKMEQNYELKSKESDEKFHRELQNTKDRLQKDFQSFHQRTSENSQSMQDRILKLEEERNSLEVEVSRLRSELVSSKLKADEDLMNAKTKLKQEELVRSRQYDERIHLLQTSFEELQLQSTKQQSKISELQSQLSAITRENEINKRQLETMKQQLDQKESEYRNEVNRSRLELDSERKTQSELRDRILSLENQINSEAKRHRDILAQKESELSFVSEQLRTRESEIKRNQEEEVKRAEMLEKAIYSYVSSTKTASRPNSPYKT